MKHIVDPASGNQYPLLSLKGLSIYQKISEQVQSLLQQGGMDNLSETLNSSTKETSSDMDELSSNEILKQINQLSKLNLSLIHI